MRHVVQMERGVEDALEARHRHHEHECEGERAPPHDDERQQGKRACRKGERRRRARGGALLREDGAIGGAEAGSELVSPRSALASGPPVAGCHGCAQTAPGRLGSRSATHTTTTSQGRRLTGAILSVLHGPRTRPIRLEPVGASGLLKDLVAPEPCVAPHLGEAE